MPDCPYFRPPPRAPLLDRFSTIFILPPPPLHPHILLPRERGRRSKRRAHRWECEEETAGSHGTHLGRHTCMSCVVPLSFRCIYGWVAVQILVHSRRRRLGTHVRRPQRRIARPRLSFTIPPPSSEHKSIMPPQYA